MAESPFDNDALKRVFEGRDAGKVLEFYSDDLEHIEIDSDAPPKSPRVHRGTQYIRDAIQSMAENDIKLYMENAAVGRDRAACTITVEFPDGRRLISNTVYDLRDGKIVRQLDVQVSDPEER
jgi:SnoaL-like domain